MTPLGWSRTSESLVVQCVDGRPDHDEHQETSHPRVGRAEAAPSRSAPCPGSGRGRRLLVVADYKATYYQWRNQFGGLKANDAKRLIDLERETSMPKRLLADAELEKAALRGIAKGNFWARSDGGRPCTT